MASQWESWRPAIAAILTDAKVVSGTGFFLGPDGYVITCYHVIDGIKEIGLRLADGSEHLAVLDLEKSVPSCDLAVMKTAASLHFFNPLTDFDEDRAVVNSSGYQFYGGAVQDIFPAGHGRILSTTSLSLLNKYQLNPVYVVDNKFIQSGISGAPLIVEGYRQAAAGLINANLAAGVGFALPFRTACAQSKQFNDFVAALTKQAELAELENLRMYCKQQVDFELDRLTRAKKYLPEYYCPRSTVEEAFTDFMASNKRVFPIIGNAGNGKTSSLAALTGHKAAKDSILIFLPVYLLRPENNLETEIRQRLTAVTGTVPEELFTRFSPNILIFLDGLNELEGNNAPVLTRWLETLLDTVRQRSFKLIFTARSDFWERYHHLFDVNLLYSTPNGNYIELEDFDFNEIRVALKHYGLPESLSEHHVLWHPLFLRLFQESIPTKGSSFQGTISILEHYLKQVCQNVDTALDLPPRYSRTRLTQIAEKFLEANDYTLKNDQFFAFCGQDPKIERQFLRENLFLDGEQYRINFDQIAEYLVSENIAQALQANPELLQSFYRESPLRRGALPLAFASLEHNTASLRLMLVQYVPLIGAVKESWLILFNFMNILFALKDAGKFGHEIVKFMTSYQEHTREHLLSHYIFQILERTNLAPQYQGELFRIGLFGAHADLNMNLGHWLELKPKDFREYLRPGDFFLDLCFNQDPFIRLATIAQIGTWLADFRPLEDKGIYLRVHDMACVLLYQIRTVELEKISDLLAAQVISAQFEFHDSSLRTLREVVQSEGSKFIPIVERWLQKGDRDELVLEVLLVCDPEWFGGDRMGEIALTLDKRVLQNNHANNLINHILIKIPAHRQAAVQRIIKDAEQGKNSGIYRLGDSLSQYFDAFYLPLVEFLHKCKHQEIQKSIASALFQSKFNPDQTRQVAKIILRYMRDPQRYPSLRYEYALGLEAQLYRKDQLTETTDDLREALHLALKMGGADITPLYYFLIYHPEENLELVEFSLPFATYNQADLLIERLFKQITVPCKGRFYQILLTILTRFRETIVKRIFVEYYIHRNVPMSDTLPKLCCEPMLSEFDSIKLLKQGLKNGLTMEDAFRAVIFAPDPEIE